MTLTTLIVVYTVGWLSGVCSVLLYDLIQLIKGK